MVRKEQEKIPEARGGIEPPHGGFADRSVSSSPSRQECPIVTLHPLFFSFAFAILRSTRNKLFVYLRSHLSMRRKWILIAGIILTVLAIAGYIFRSRFGSSQAGILIQSNPQAAVYIDGEEVGMTPYQVQRKAGELELRLVPESPDIPLSPYETKLTLTEGIETVVRRDFGPTDEESAGEVLSYEKTDGKTASIAVVSAPDASQISLDGEVRGFTPLQLDPVGAGEHQVSVIQAGFLQREIGVRAQGGYKLTVIAKLAKDPQAAAEKAAEASRAAEVVEEKEEEKTATKIEILETPVGFLRVRASASTGSAEVGRVNPGDEFVLIEESDDGDWHKIEYAKGKEGWVSSEYTKKL